MIDIQNSPDTRRINIDQVGVKNIKHPIRIRERCGNQQHTVASFNMYVRLPHHFKGTHMSRFVEMLNEHEYEITVQSFMRMTEEMIDRLDAESGYIEMTFPYFVIKSAPVSGIENLVDYQVTFISQVDVQQKRPTTLIKVVVPVTSLCPCSKEISEYGAHNQRSRVTLTVQTNRFLWIEDLIDIVEKQASCEIYGVLKRPDEKYVTERAYDNPKFVEDIVRDIALELNDCDKVTSYTVESENFESIHNHSAFAMIQRNKQHEETNDCIEMNAASPS
ncbi:MAG: GTP cyclohydrolase I FolE2 [Candidatus Electrothrix sp. MAN1_4]|nr:GTP cyclohydrolase I FolE2 [Candidatus Electrothrix sp. MAN1_4]